mmetsp:Transcript_34302/g.71777  ORF Transcript_34302/g.71777 Transcript_34302/m.71777 type:complete len:413 (+) Transcript_34302:3144-4382(+)
MEGRCKLLANHQSATLVTPSTSLALVAIGTSNSLVVWKKERGGDNPSASAIDGSLAKRRKLSAGGEDERRTTATKGQPPSPRVAPCRLVQPGGSGSSFLVGQAHRLDPETLSRFFANRTERGNTAAPPPVSTGELCNLFQAAPGQILEAMLSVPSVVSSVVGDSESNDANNRHTNATTTKSKTTKTEELWQVVPEEEVLFGQRALVDTLCEEDADAGESDGGPASMTTEELAVRVGRRLLPLLMEGSSSGNGNREQRCLSIARKTVLLASSLSSKTKAIASGSNRQRAPFGLPFEPDHSKIAFYALRDLFLKYPSYAWSDLSERWSNRLPMGSDYQRIPSTKEWIEEPTTTRGGHGGLVPNQLVFSSAAGDGNNSNETNPDGAAASASAKKENSKGVLSLVDPHAVLVWRGK